MATQTPNYNLTKPDPNTDYYNIEVHNDNADIIDAALKAHEDELATKETPEGAETKVVAHEEKADPHNQYALDTDLAELQEDVDANTTKLASIESGANKTVISNILTGTSTTKALSEAQGKTLKDAADAHEAENASTSAKGHVQLSTSTTSTSTSTAATSSAVKAAMDKANSAFQSANDGKTGIANAVTAKGVAASPSDTFATLATKIGQINTEPFISVQTGFMDGLSPTEINTTHTFTHGLGKTPSVVVVTFSAVNQSYPDRVSEYSYVRITSGHIMECKRFTPSGRTPETPDIKSVTVNATTVSVLAWHKGSGYGNYDYTIRCAAV